MMMITRKAIEAANAVLWHCTCAKTTRQAYTMIIDGPFRHHLASSNSSSKNDKETCMLQQFLSPGSRVQ